MDRDAALRLRADAGQPLAWPEGNPPPLSRLTLTQMAASDCAELGIEVESWQTSLGEDHWDVLHEALAERLGLSWEDAPVTPTFGALVLWIEGALVERWRALSAVTDPDREAVDAILAAVRVVAGPTVEADTPLASALSENQRPDFWRHFPSPWDRGNPTFRTVRRPDFPRTLVALGLWMTLGGLLMTRPGISLRVALFWWFIAALFVGGYGFDTRQEWIDTPTTLAARMAQSWRDEVANLEELERTWSEM